MYWSYGTHTHSANEVNLLNFSKTRKKSRRGYRETEIRTVVLRGELIYSTQQQLSDAISVLELAYFYDGLDLIFYQDDGTRTPHTMLSNDPFNISGVTVKSLSYPVHDGGEYATARTYQLVLEAEYDVSEKEVLDFTEQVRFLGTCGPRWRAIEMPSGPPEVQVISENSVQRIIQQGRAISLDAYFAYPPPLFPNIEHSEMADETLTSPRRNRKRLTHYETRWRYVYSSGIRQNAFPHTY